LSGGAALARIPVGAKTATVYYAVCLGEYTDYDEAKTAALNSQKDGAAGYVISDGNYKLVASVYKTYADAEKVCARISGASIYEMRFDNPSLKKYGASDRARIERALGYGFELYDELYYIGNEADKAQIDLVSARNRIHSLIQKTQDRIDTLAYKREDEIVFLKLQNDLTATIAALTYLMGDESTIPNFAANVRYTFVMILNMYRALLKGEN
jgi:hypothetical protein